MRKCEPPNPVSGESWLDNPPVIFDETLVQEIPIKPAQHPRTTVDLNWRHETPTVPMWETRLNRFLVVLWGREPLSTLILTAAGLLVGAAQSDVTDLYGWLLGAVIALIGRLMNERSPNY